MNLLNKFFAKKKYDVDDEDLVWKRTDTDQAYNIHQLQEISNPDPADMFMPRSYTSKINPGPFEASKSYQKQKTPKRQSRASMNNQGQFGVYRQSNTNYTEGFGGDSGGYKVHSGYNTPKGGDRGTGFDFNANYNGNGNDHYTNNYTDTYTNNNTDNYTGSYSGNNNGNYDVYNQFNYNPNPNYNNNNDLDLNYENVYSQPNPRIRNVTSQPHNGYSFSPQKDRNMKPELRDYYNIEENIMKKMMQSKEIEKQPVANKNVNIFGGRSKVSNDKATTHFRDAVRRNPNPPVIDQKLPTEIKRRKNLVFKAADDNGPKAETAVDLKPDSTTLELESHYMGKSMDELQKLLREKNMKLAQLEEQNFQLVNNETNVTYVQRQIHELDREIAKLREKNGHLETEQRLLYEDLMNKKDVMNEIEVTMAKVPPMDKPDAQAKKDLIERISKNQQYIADLNEKLESYEEGKNKELEDIKKNSEKNMQMELEEIKINIMNYDDELLKWLRFFETKVSSTANSNVLDQSIF